MQQNQFDDEKEKILSVAVNQAAGTTLLIAAVPAVVGGPGSGLPGTPAQAIEVCGFLLTGSAASTVKFNDSTNSVDLTGPMQILAGGSLTQSINYESLFKAAPGAALSLITTGGTITGFVNYKLSPPLPTIA